MDVQTDLEPLDHRDRRSSKLKYGLLADIARRSFLHRCRAAPHQPQIPNRPQVATKPGARRPGDARSDPKRVVRAGKSVGSNGRDRQRARHSLPAVAAETSSSRPGAPSGLPPHSGMTRSRQRHDRHAHPRASTGGKSFRCRGTDRGRYRSRR